MDYNRNESRISMEMLSNAVDIICSNCESRVFQPVLTFKKISAILSPTGEEIIIPIETCVCVKCGNINDEFNPDLKGS